MIEVRYVVPVLIALAACSSEAPRVEEPRERPEEPADSRDTLAIPERLSCEDLARTILKVAPVRAALASEFGQPDSVVATTEPNRHDPGRTDSLFTVHYPGLISSLRKPGGGEDMTDHAVVTANRFLAYPSIGVGAPEDRVIRVLGEPTRRTADSLVYECGMHVEEPVTFHLEDGVVRRIDIAYYLD